MIDKFSSFSEGLNAPAGSIAVVTPNDAADLPMASRSLRVAAAGTIVLTLVDMPDGVSVTVPTVQAGERLPYRAKRVWATGTTALGIIAEW